MANVDVTSKFLNTIKKLLDAGHSVLVEEEVYRAPSIPAIWGMTQDGGREVRRSRVGSIKLVELSIPNEAGPVRLEVLTSEQQADLVRSLKVLALESLERKGARGMGDWIGIKDEHGSISPDRTDRFITQFRIDSRVANDGVHAGKRLFMIVALRWTDQRTIPARPG
ncbi:hypothetical protein [Sorangium sp. So ce1078]|uniref:hypothetical protein n=1 Tax=Sorangium sp. So ce1078 TaxID=3133329 RepID=UPI003F622C40